MTIPSDEMTVTLSDELARYVREKARDGAFATPDAYVRDLVRARYLAEREREAAQHAIDAALTAGLADAAAGRTRPIGDAFAHVRAAITIPEAGPAE